MDINSNRFERLWGALFLFLYFFILIPFPWYFNTEYQAAWLGIPSYVLGWLVHAFIVLVMINIFAKSCLKRPEYQ